MLEPLKNSLLASLGLAALAQEKLQGVVKDLVDRGELSTEQGGKLVDAFIEKGEQESQDLSEKVGRELSRWLEKTPFATHQQVRELEGRLHALEERLGSQAPDEVEPLGSH